MRTVLSGSGAEGRAGAWAAAIPLVKRRANASGLEIFLDWRCMAGLRTGTRAREKSSLERGSAVDLGMRGPEDVVMSRLCHAPLPDRPLRSRWHVDRLDPAHPRQLPPHLRRARLARADGRGARPGGRHAAALDVRELHGRRPNNGQVGRDVPGLQPRAPRRARRGVPGRGPLRARARRGGRRARDRDEQEPARHEEGPRGRGARGRLFGVGLRGRRHARQTPSRAGRSRARAARQRGGRGALHRRQPARHARGQERRGGDGRGALGAVFPRGARRRRAEPLSGISGGDPLALVLG